MGLMVDTNVFIAWERSGDVVDLSPWEPSEEVFISAITVSELLIGAHDLLIAATALHHNLSLLTDNLVEFRRVPGLNVIEFGP